MEINYVLEPKDLIKFNKIIAKSGKTHKPLVAIFTSIFLLFMFADLIYAFFAGTMGDWTVGTFLFNLVIRAFVLSALLGIILGVLYYVQLKAVNKFAENPNGVLCEHKIVINETELIEITDVNTSRHSWRGISNIEEIDEFIKIDVASSASYVIPKRFFQNRGQIEEFIGAAEHFQQNAINSFNYSHLAAFDDKS
jgi:hypothetical protein